MSTNTQLVNDMTDTSMTDEEFFDKLQSITWKAPDYFSKPVHEQIAIQVARTIRDKPSQRTMMIYTYDNKRERPLHKFVFCLDDI